MLISSSLDELYTSMHSLQQQRLIQEMSKSTNTITSQCTTIYTTCGMRYYVPMIQCHGIDMLCTLLCQQTFSRREKGCKTWDMVNRLTMTRLNQHHINHPMRGEQPTLTDTCKFDVSILNQQKNLFSYNYGMYYKNQVGMCWLENLINFLGCSWGSHYPFQ